MMTVAAAIVMLKGKTDIVPEMFVLTGIFDIVVLIIVTAAAYNLLELYLRCGGGG